MLVVCLHGGNRYSGDRILQKTDKYVIVVGMSIDEHDFWFNPSQKITRAQWEDQDDVRQSYPDINREKIMSDWPFKHDTLKKLFNPKTKLDTGDMEDDV
jgi:hypothetical protein